MLFYAGLHVSRIDASVVPGAAIPRWLNAHAKPLPIGAAADYVEDGGALAIFLSALEMGQLAMQYALTWLRAGNTAELPLVESTHFRVGVREALLGTWNVTLPRIYSEAAHFEELDYP